MPQGFYRQTSVDPTFNSVFRSAGDRAARDLIDGVTVMAQNAATSAFFASFRLATYAIPKVASTKLGHIVDDLYKGTKAPNPIGRGTTADAIRNELVTGVPTYGKLHFTKGREYLTALNTWLRNNPGASRADRAIAESLKRDLEAALSGR